MYPWCKTPRGRRVKADRPRSGVPDRHEKIVLADSYVNVHVYASAEGSGWRPLGPREREQVEENVYESVAAAAGGRGRGAFAPLGAYWWMRVAPPCRRHRRVSQTVEFHESPPAPAAGACVQGTVPRARRLVRGVCGVRLQRAPGRGARLSASCGTIGALAAPDAPAPCVLLLPPPRERPDPEEDEAAPHHRHEHSSDSEPEERR
ncbi:hypothetical protein KGM_213185 [Danaus plexippus plexippus]|uniref:Uncharacterized protein n=1 Tax=Danaus plexippus plexippus TaxID=278856 RepID=A0A212FAV1_DANPL|nr:hypothetical protein KGM_213185 [Danaus plexippus plexippus]